MSPSRRLLTRLLPFALPLTVTVACGGKSELTAPDPEDETAGRSGGGSGGASGKGGQGGSGVGGTLGIGGSSSGGGPVATAGAGGTSPGVDLPACPESPFCPQRCYARAAGEACLPLSSLEPIYERIGCIAPSGIISLLDEQPTQCCYAIGECAGVGRPVIIAGKAIVGALVLTSSWV